MLIYDKWLLHQDVCSFMIDAILVRDGLRCPDKAESDGSFGRRYVGESLEENWLKSQGFPPTLL
jgi:hypothetical protein